MMNIRIDEAGAYVEIEIFGAYDTERMGEVIAAMRDLAARHASFGVIERHYSKPQNLLRAVMAAGKNADTTDAKFVEKLQRYAIVADEPSMAVRIMAAMSKSAPLQIRIFPQHEGDAARAWVSRRA